jgi:large subunit ribosomal protein L10
MDRAQKPVVVAELNAAFGEVGVVVVTRNLGLTVAQSTALRTKMREANATYKVTKNSLAKIAAKGTAYEGLSDLLTGPIALASSIDPVAAAKVVVDFAKTNDKLEIVGGSMGSMVLDGPRAGTRNQGGSDHSSTGWAAGARLCGLCRQRSSLNFVN